MTHGMLPESAAVTTSLMCCWGLITAYVLFDAMLTRRALLPCMEAILTLFIVWSTLERKRWGRLALLGICFTGPVLVVASLAVSMLRLPQTALLSLHTALTHADALIALLLAATTALWLRRPTVAAEFDRGKRATLARAQQSIAAFIVICWSLMLMGSGITRFGQSDAEAGAQRGSCVTTSKSH